MSSYLYINWWYNHTNIVGELKCQNITLKYRLLIASARRRGEGWQPLNKEVMKEMMCHECEVWEDWWWQGNHKVRVNSYNLSWSAKSVLIQLAHVKGRCCTMCLKQVGWLLGRKHLSFPPYYYHLRLQPFPAATLQCCQWPSCLASSYRPTIHELMNYIGQLILHTHPLNTCVTNITQTSCELS